MTVTTQMYYIWSWEHRGWWRPGRRGYTQDLGDAGKYTLHEAFIICHGANRNFHTDPDSMPNEGMVPVPDSHI